MFTFIAWHHSGGEATSREPDLDRVERVLVLDGVTRDGIVGRSGSFGLCVWDPEPEALRVRRFVRSESQAVAAIGAPAGVMHCAGTSAPEAVLLKLSEALRSSDDHIAKIAPPFAIVSCDVDVGVRCQTDGLGMARVYQSERNRLWAWSNRPAALAAFGAAEFGEDELAWSGFAACGWFAEMSSPIHGVRRLAPGAVVLTSPNGAVRQKNTGVLSGWLNDYGQSYDSSATADAMIEYVRAVADLTGSTVESMLSGGRDSRVVSAAVFAAGVSASFTTLGPLQGEISTAQTLLAHLGGRVPHTVRQPSPPGERAELRERVLGLHRTFDGDMTPIKLNSPVSGRLPARAVLGGAGGEIGHANYYTTARRLEDLKQDGSRAGVRRLQAYFRTMPGPTEESHQRVDRLVEYWAGVGREFGIDGPTFLDFFYLIERLRRWAPAANSPGSYSLFAVPEFIAAAFQMTPEERLGGQLHVDLLRRLVPAWADVAFYKATSEESAIKSRRGLRIWQGKDRVSMTEVLDSPSSWSDVFEVEVIRRLWADAVEDRLANRFEAIFQRVVWRAVFSEYIADIRRSAG